jgi:hypothetical protein
MHKTKMRETFATITPALGAATLNHLLVTGPISADAVVQDGRS